MKKSDLGRSVFSLTGTGPRPYLTSVLLVVIAGSLLPLPVRAQREAGTIGTGVQVVNPGGLTLKWYRSAPIAYDAVISTDGDDFAVTRVHRLWETPLPDSPLHLYLGPGLVAGSEGLAATPRLRLGLSAEAGLNFYAERFEVFLHVTPTLRFLPDTDVRFNGVVGLRYYFHSF